MHNISRTTIGGNWLFWYCSHEQKDAMFHKCLIIRVHLRQVACFIVYNTVAMSFALYPSVTLPNINERFTFMADSLLVLEVILKWRCCRIMSHMNINIPIQTCLNILCWAMLCFNKETLKKLLKLLPLGICCTFSIQELQHSYIFASKAYENNIAYADICNRDDFCCRNMHFWYV